MSQHQAELRAGLIFLEGLIGEDLLLGKKEQAQKKIDALRVLVKGWQFLADNMDGDANTLIEQTAEAANDLLPYLKQQRGRKTGAKMPHTVPVDRQVRDNLADGATLGRSLKKLPSHQQNAAKAREQRRRRKQKQIIASQT